MTQNQTQSVILMMINTKKIYAIGFRPILNLLLHLLNPGSTATKTKKATIKGAKYLHMTARKKYTIAEINNSVK